MKDLSNKISNRPLVSIICTCYNHEKYILQAIEGFLMQKTDFPFEIIIHDDASTDNSKEIIKEYEEKYPELFFNIYQIENQYSKGVEYVTKVVFQAAQGKYIAFCEGDDYWIDPYKLQKQVDILEYDYSIGMVHTSCKFWDEKKEIFLTPFLVNSKNIKYSFSRIFLGTIISTCTTMFRRSLLVNMEDIPPGDISLWLFIALKSKVIGMPDVTGVYRKIESKSASKWNDNFERIKVLENWVKIQTYYYINYDVPLYLLIIKYIRHFIEMVKMSLKTRRISPLYKGFIFVKSEISQIIKQKK